MKSLNHRNYGVDVAKCIAIFAVILIHAHPFGFYEGTPRTLLEIGVNQLARFAVPFFFIMAGYYFGCSIEKGACPRVLALVRAKRLMLLFGLWTLLYLVIQLHMVELGLYGYVRLVYWQLLMFMDNPLRLLLEGSATHLWFLPALAIGTCVAAMGAQAKSWVLMLTVALLYPLGVLSLHYDVLSISMGLWIGPFMATIFLLIGMLLSRVNLQRLPKLLGPVLILIGATGQCLECWSMEGIKDLTTVDYVFSTLPFGLGVTITALHWCPKPSIFSQMGAQTLGIYLCHIWFIQVLSFVRIYDTWLNHWLIPVAVLLMAYAFTLTMQRMPKLRFVFAS